MGRTLLWVAVAGWLLGGHDLRAAGNQTNQANNGQGPGATSAPAAGANGSTGSQTTPSNSGSQHPTHVTPVHPPWYPPGTSPHPYPYYYSYPNSVYPYGSYGYLYPPVVVPAGTMFGPQSVQQFLGADSSAGSGSSSAHSGSSGGAGMAPPAPAGSPDAGDSSHALRATNPDALQRAKRLIDFGDGHFSNGRYSDALDRYRSAAEAAPTLAAAVFRQGFALVAQKRFDQAARAFKRGLEIDPNWAQSDFTLNELYAHHPQSKPVHLEALAAAAVNEPTNADLLYMVGLYLYFDGKRERAAALFERAGQLNPGMPALKGFLDRKS